MAGRAKRVTCEAFVQNRCLFDSLNTIFSGFREGFVTFIFTTFKQPEGYTHEEKVKRNKLFKLKFK